MNIKDMIEQNSKANMEMQKLKSDFEKVQMETEASQMSKENEMKKRVEE